MSMNTFPEDMVSGSSWAEQIGSGYLMANPMNAMAAATASAMFWPMATMGAMTGAWLASLEMMGMRNVARTYSSFLEEAVTPATSPRKHTQAATAANITKPKAATAAKPKSVAFRSATKTARRKPAKATPSGPQRPAGLEAPRAGKADDLKTISGIGPKLEVVLNDLGIYHFDQIAAWTPGEVDWVDDYLKFKGRIERDGWLKQASDLARAA